MTLPIAVLISGGGSNLQSIIDRMEAGSLDVSIRLVVSNDAGAFGLERAKKHGIETFVLDHKTVSDREKFDRRMIKVIKDAGAEAVALAGFMRLITPSFLAAFPQKVVNIHPALLPSFPGLHGQKQAAEYGVKMAGCTVHFVDERVDQGPIIIQAAVKAFPEDDEASLGERILKLEHRIYPQALQWLAEGRLSIEGRKVILTRGSKLPSEEQGGGEFFIHPPLEQGF